MTSSILSTISLNITAESVAWYGAILATVSSVVSLYTFWKDRAKVKVWYSFDNFISGDEHTMHLRVDVTNLGRRPIKITHVGAKDHNDPRTMLFGDSFYKQNEDRILTEQNPSVTYITKQEGVDRESLWYIYAIDARGKEFRAYPTSRDRMRFWLYFPKRFVARHAVGKKK